MRSSASACVFSPPPRSASTVCMLTICPPQLGSPQISPNKKAKKGKPTGTPFSHFHHPLTRSQIRPPHRLPRLTRQSRPRRLRPPLKRTLAPALQSHPRTDHSAHPDPLPGQRRCAPQSTLEAARLLDVLPRPLLIRLARLVARGWRHARVVLREPEPRAPACQRAWKRRLGEGQAAGDGDGPAEAPVAATPAACALPHGCVARCVCAVPFHS